MAVVGETETEPLSALPGFVKLVVRHEVALTDDQVIVALWPGVIFVALEVRVRVGATDVDVTASDND